MQNFNAAFSKINPRKAPLAWALALVHRGQKSAEPIFYEMLSVNYKSNEKSFALIFEHCKIANAFSQDEGESCVNVPTKALSELACKAFSTLDASTHPNAAALRFAHEYHREIALIFIDSDSAPKNAAEVFLKLHLLSRCFVEPRSIDLNGAFALLKNLAWDERGKPYELDFLRENEARLRCANEWPNITMVDKFPRYLQCVIGADNVRILDAAKVRLGAHLAPGTVLMPGASYVNFNAGTLGAAMVEGRISSSAIVGANSDIGGGASILGVLSGTDGTPLSIGERCLLGANSTVGIRLGDDCIVDAGVAALSGAKARVQGAEQINAHNKTNAALKTSLVENQTYKLSELSGLNALHIRRDSRSGELIVLHNQKAIALNPNLH